ncbi:MAG: hypothetical protein KUG82_17505 [Pseudomonadales bacterium]|nr:hypothetical protein [Pseudomonadales bacterium]
MIEKGSKKDDEEGASVSEAPSYDLNKAIENYQQRIKNLEQFRDLFFELQDKMTDGSMPASLLDAKDDESIDPSVPSLESTPCVEKNSINELKTALKESELQVEEYRRVIEGQGDEITSLDRQLKESKNCGEMIEIELERLIEDNETLRVGVKEEKLAADAESTDLKDAMAKVQSLEEEVDQATELAFGSMRSNADLGAVVHFLMQCFSCSTYADLAKQISITLTNYGMEGVLQIRIEGQSNYFGSDGENVSDTLSIELLEAHGDSEEIVDVENHLICNGQVSSLIVTGYDSSNIEAYNNLKDNLVMVVMGLDANTRRISTELTIERERATLEKLIMATHRALQTFESDLQNQSSQAQDHVSELVSKFRQEVSIQSVTNEQKNNLLKVVVTEIAKVEAVIKAVKIDPGFKHIINTLGESVSGKRKVTKPE